MYPVLHEDYPMVDHAYELPSGRPIGQTTGPLLLWHSLTGKAP